MTNVHIGRYPAVLCVLHAGFVMAASDLCAVRKSIHRLLPLCIVALAGVTSLITWAGAWPFAVKVLDADQANCAIVTSRGHTYVFDVGDTYSPAADYLSATCLHLDALFLSHPHEDHAGGLSDLLKAFRPDVIYVPVGWFDCQQDSAPSRLLEQQPPFPIGWKTSLSSLPCGCLQHGSCFVRVHKPRRE